MGKPDPQTTRGPNLSSEPLQEGPNLSQTTKTLGERIAESWRDKPRLIVHDTNVCWRFPDGSHRGVTQSDVWEINILLDRADRDGIDVRINGQ